MTFSLPPAADLSPGTSLALVARVADVEAQEALAFDLPAAEEARIARHVRADDRAARRAAWRLARALVGAVLDVPPAAVPVARGTNGRPHLPGAGDLDFNLTHSRGVVAVGLARGGRIGVDVEHPRPLALWTDLAPDILDPADRALWSALPEGMRAGAALALWCGKEAVLKATGEGLGGDPRAVRLDVAGAPSRVVRGGMRLQVAAGAVLPPATFACAVERAAPPRVLVLSGAGDWRDAAL